MTLMEILLAVLFVRVLVLVVKAIVVVELIVLIA